MTDTALRPPFAPTTPPMVPTAAIQSLTGGMSLTYFPVPDEFYRDPQFLGWSPEAYALWMIAGSWSVDRLTDGFVPAAALALFPSGVCNSASELVERGIWRRARLGGYQYVDWPRECSRAYVEAKRESEKQRKRRQRGTQKGDPA